MLMLLFFVATLDKILLCFLKKARSRQSHCASHVARTFISAFHRPCFTAPWLNAPNHLFQLRLQQLGQVDTLLFDTFHPQSGQHHPLEDFFSSHSTFSALITYGDTLSSSDAKIRRTNTGLVSKLVCTGGRIY